MRILFIIPDNYQEDNHFPLGIAYLASVLEKDKHSVIVSCADVFHYSNEQIQRIIKNTEPDIIGIGFLAARFRETILPLCKAVNEVKGNAWLILGGHGASPIPDYIKKETKADTIFVGEGESLSKALRVIEEYPSDKWASIHGVLLKDLDSIPFPAWHLFPMGNYTTCLKLPGWEKGDRTLGILTSRGCVGKCNFCYRMHKGLRLRSIDSVIEEIEILQERYGITYFFMQDELFVSSKKRIFEFQQALSKKNIKIKYACDARVNNVDESVLDSLKDSGCQFLDYGFESMDNKVLSIMKKGQTAEDNYRCAKLTQKAGIPFNINILWGNIGDTLESLKKNIEFINEFNTYKNIRTIRPPTPYPGCELYDYAIMKGLLKDADDFFNKFKNSDLMTVNFTDIPDREFYQELYRVNCSLIDKYFDHHAFNLSRDFYNLYFGNNVNFRGARHYV